MIGMIGLVLHFNTIKTSKHKKESMRDNVQLPIGCWVREAGIGSHWPIPYTLTE